MRFILPIWLSLFSPLVQTATADYVASVARNGDTFYYTVTNNDPVGSPNYVSLWDLSVNAPFIVIDIPTGWDFVTDNESYINWFNTDPLFPYPNDIAPGRFLSGFIIQSAVTSTELLPYAVGSWDHVLDASGPASFGVVAAPSGVPASAVPEPASVAIFLSGLFGFSCYMRFRHK